MIVIIVTTIYLPVSNQKFLGIIRFRIDFPHSWILTLGESDFIFFVRHRDRQTTGWIHVTKEYICQSISSFLTYNKT